MDVATKAFGERMKEQVEERLRFYEDGIAPGKNIDAMQACPRQAPGPGPAPSLDTIHHRAWPLRTVDREACMADLPDALSDQPAHLQGS